ncbi:MAG: 50S ribosomal protein L3 [Gammaproteobacteria bacterium]|nr:50S ribosomal protein L3 [Gammaproteobacteria bacterium]
MAIGLVGKKAGMTRVFTEDGASVPVTVIEATPNRITQIKTDESDGYSAIQVTAGEARQNRVSKPQAGHFAKANTGAGRGLWEFRTLELAQLAVGGELTVEQFSVGEKIDIRGVSKGKGFAGTIKRWNFAGQDATHGNSISHRVPGSIGMCQTPGRVFKGKKMSGHMGSENVTTQNLEIVRIDVDKGLILVKGAVPGATGGDIEIRPAVKGSDTLGVVAKGDKS